MLGKLWETWCKHRHWRRARAEARHLVTEAKRILKRKSYRIPQSAASEVQEAVASVEDALRASDLDKLRSAISALDDRVDRHLAFARKSTVREYAESIGVALAVALFLRAFVVEAFQIPSGSMIPTLQIGDHIFVSKFTYGVGIPFTNKKLFQLGEPQRGDVIVFKYPPDPSTDYIKRVVGLPGDSVELRHNEVFINGRPMSRERVDGTCRYSEGRGPESSRDCELWIEQLDHRNHRVYQHPDQMPQDWGPRVVPAQSVFVMGDNRDNSRDSRVWGFVPYPNIKGRALIVWWSRDPAFGGVSLDGVVEWFKSIRFGRFFKAVD